MIASANQGTLSVSYLNDRKETIQCLVDKPFQNLSYNGYFGITARNKEKESFNFDMHVRSIKLTNFDPTKYVRNDELLTVAELNVVDD